MRTVQPIAALLIGIDATSTSRRAVVAHGGAPTTSGRVGADADVDGRARRAIVAWLNKERAKRRARRVAARPDRAAVAPSIVAHVVRLVVLLGTNALALCSRVGVKGGGALRAHFAC